MLAEVSPFNRDLDYVEKSSPLLDTTIKLSSESVQAVRALPHVAGDPNTSWERIVKTTNRSKITDREDIVTVDQVFSETFRQFGNLNCLGTRPVQKVETVPGPNGKPFQQTTYGNYEWHSFSEVDRQIKILCQALQGTNHPANKVLIFAETRAEWMIAAQAIFRAGLTLVTLYPLLGDEGLAHSIAELDDLNMAFTSSYNLAKLRHVNQKAGNRIKTFITFDEQPEPIEGDPVQVITFDRFISSSPKTVRPAGTDKDTVAMILYTSGSTGMPKGVQLTHTNLIAVISNFAFLVDYLEPSNDAYLAFLPLSHVGELAIEMFIMSLGVPIGYGSPQTYIDGASGLAKGCPGDSTLLKPTIVYCVPLILERIKKQMMDPLTENQRAVLNWTIDQRKQWAERGNDTAFVYQSIQDIIGTAFGGKCKYMICGGSPLSPDTDAFVRYGLDIRLLIGYGLTEVTCVATLQHPEDLVSAGVGYPAAEVKLRLRDWPEGGYMTTDKPRPRGEVLIAGRNLSPGYYKRPEVNKDTFIEIDGERWLASGDIGEIDEFGALHIVDRKKDLVKLSHGIYVPLGHVEAALKPCPIVENICMHGTGYNEYTIAIVYPNRTMLHEMASKLGLPSDLSEQAICSNPLILKQFLEQLRAYGDSKKLNKMENPRKLILSPFDWTPDNGLVTAAFKIRRTEIYPHFEKQLKRLYSES